MYAHELRAEPDKIEAGVKILAEEIERAWLKVTKNCLMRYAYQAYMISAYIEFGRICRPDKAF